jgi:hypothetical protein
MTQGNRKQNSKKGDDKKNPGQGAGSREQDRNVEDSHSGGSNR